jgi:hypothetical protein
MSKVSVEATGSGVSQNRYHPVICRYDHKATQWLDVEDIKIRSAISRGLSELKTSSERGVAERWIIDLKKIQSDSLGIRDTYGARI